MKALHRQAVLLSIFLGTICLLSGCSVFSPVKGTMSHQYVINTVPSVPQKKSVPRVILYVAPTEATMLNNTLQMTYTIQRYRINYFAKNEWAETPAQMFYPLLIETLQRTHYFKTLAPATTLGSFDLMLNTQILIFQQEFFGHESDFHMKVRAQLTKGNTNRVIASKDFSAVVPASPSPYGGVIAANEASAKILANIAQWSMRHRYSSE